MASSSESVRPDTILNTSPTEHNEVPDAPVQESVSVISKIIKFGSNVCSACSTLKRWTWGGKIRRGITLTIISLALIYFGRAYLLGIPPKTVFFDLFAGGYRVVSYITGGAYYMLAKGYKAAFS